jgi:hypothetical protein
VKWIFVQVDGVGDLDDLSEIHHRDAVEICSTTASRAKMKRYVSPNSACRS